MRHAPAFLEKLRSGEVCYGVTICSPDPLLTEALSTLVDGVWLDTEHAPISIESLQPLIMAAQLSGAAALVRVPCKDPVRMKPVLDLGADGLIVPMVRSAADVREAVAGCRYPPLGVRGFGPRRASRFGHYGTTSDYIEHANEHIIVLAQIEHVGAVKDIDAILATEGLTGVIIGANDLSLSMGLAGRPDHPKVIEAIETVLDKARCSDKFVGMATGGDPDTIAGWIERGVQWMVMETETSLMMHAAREIFTAVRYRVARGARLMPAPPAQGMA